MEEQLKDLLVNHSDELIKPTKRLIDELPEHLRNVKQIFFNFQHDIDSAIGFFQSFHGKQSVIFGHKNQGKSQFLYFLARILQEVGEFVFFCDAFCFKQKNMILYDSQSCLNPESCSVAKKLKEAIDSFEYPEKFTESVSDPFEKLLNSNQENRPKMMKKFLSTLSHLSEFQRVWVFIDEATSFALPDYCRALSRFLPKEQISAPFHLIITGSKGMSTLVAKNHLDKWVWDLPVFTEVESSSLAVDLWKLLGKGIICRSSYSFF